MQPKQGRIAYVKAFVPSPPGDDVQATRTDHTPSRMPSHERSAQAPKQGAVDAAKLRTAPEPSEKRRGLDVDALLSSLRLKLSLPSPTPQRVGIGWIERRRIKPGAIHSWARLWQDDDGDSSTMGIGAAELQTSSITVAQQKLSTIALAKAHTIPGRSPPVTLVSPPGAAPQTRPREVSIDVWAEPPTRRHSCSAVACMLVRSLFRCVTQPPCASLKLFGTFPGLLLGVWFVIVRALPLGPLAPYVALTMAVSTIILQAYAVAFPLTAAFALLAIQLGEIIDAAFAAMDEHLRASLRRSVAPMRLPRGAEDRIVHILHLPPATAVTVVRSLLPDFETLLPQSFKSGRTLAPIVFVLLLCMLIVIQVVPVLMLGLAGNGDLLIWLCTTICFVLAQLAVSAPRVLELAVRFVEALANGLVQYLLRKVLNVKRLQALADVAHDPRRAMGLARRDDAFISTEVATITQWRMDVTIQPARGTSPHSTVTPVSNEALL